MTHYHAIRTETGIITSGACRDNIRPYDEENQGFECLDMPSEIAAACFEDSITGGYVPSWDREGGGE